MQVWCRSERFRLRRARLRDLGSIQLKTCPGPAPHSKLSGPYCKPPVPKFPARKKRTASLSSRANRSDGSFSSTSPSAMAFNLFCIKLSSIVEDAVPRDTMHTIEQRYQGNLHKALFLSRELIRIVDRLSALGIEVMPYKGLALAEQIYRDIALRQAGDIDMLIHPQDLPRVREAVSELGYTPHLAFSTVEERAYLQSGYEYSFDGAAGPNLLEVQWAIQPSFYAIDFDMPGLFQRATAINVAGRPMKTLRIEDLFSCYRRTLRSTSGDASSGSAILRAS